jgi:transketolase
MRELAQIVSMPLASRRKPLAFIAHTVKGKGVSFMEDDNNWHYRIPNEDEVVRAHRELGCAV